MNFILPHNHGQAIEELLPCMPPDSDFLIVSDIFKMLDDSSLLHIFWLLCHCEECLINLSALLNMSSPAISHHLKLLKAAGLVVSRRSGKEVYYKASDSRQVQLLHTVIEQLVEISCPAPAAQKSSQY